MQDKVKACRDCRHSYTGQGQALCMSPRYASKSHNYITGRAFVVGVSCQETREYSEGCGHDAKGFEAIRV